MPRPAVLASHARAGSLDSTRLAVRVREATAETLGEEALPVAAQASLAPGWRPLGPVELYVGVRSGADATTLDTRVRNAADRELWLESAIVGLRWTGCGARSLRFLRHGWQSGSFTGSRELDERGEPEFPSGPWLRGMHHAVGAVPEDRRGWHESELVTVVGATPSGPACIAGVLERGRAFGVIYLRREGGDVLLEVELRLGAVLAPGEIRELEPVRLALGEGASALLEAFGEAHGAAAQARVARPFLSGWCSWYHFFSDVTEDDVLRNLEALRAQRDGLPLDLVQIDDGYQRAVGDWLETNEKFPRGLAELAGEIREAGFVPGLWTAPFCAVRESALFEKHRDWLLRRGDNLFRGLLHPTWSRDGSVFVLDTSRKDVLRHLARVFRELKAMGFSYLKLDFLYTAAMRACARDPRVGRAERLRRGLEAVRAGAGEEAFLLGCACPLGAAVGVVDGMRIGPDVAPSWGPDPAVVLPGLEPALPATRSAVRSALARVWMHRRLWLNHPDCLMARSSGTELSAAERRTLAAAIAATGGLALVSDDLPALSEADRRLLCETVSVAREVDGAGIPGLARALGLLESEVARGAAATNALGAIVALVNAGDQPAECAVELAAVGVDGLAGRPEPLLDSRRLRADGRSRVEGELAPHESALLRLARAFPLAIFCDFDGTFAVQDVGATLAKRHAGDRRPAMWARYQRGEISAWEYNLEILDGLCLPLAELEAFLCSVELDPGARGLLDWCGERGIPFRVLSDGFDYNLNRLQVIHSVRFAYDANRLRYEDGVWRIRSGYPNPDCPCGTGTCKGGRIAGFRARHPHATLVHIGNGRVSDLCGALAADVVFAKDTLASELEARAMPFERFATLCEVPPRLEALLGG